MQDLAKSIQNIDLATMPQNMTAGQALNVVKSNATLINTFAPGTNITQMTGLLQGGMNLSQQLPNLMKGGMNINALGSLMGANGNIMASLQNFNPAQLQGMLNGQLSMMGNFNMGNLGQFASSLNIPTNLLSNLSPDTLMSQAQGLMSQGAAMVQGFNPQATVSNMMSELNKAKDSLAGLADSTTINNLSANVSANIPGIANISANTTVGELRQLVSAQQSGLSQMNPSALMSQIGPGIQSQFTSLAQNFPPTARVIDTANFLRAQSSNFSSIASGLQNVNMSSITASMQAQIGSVGVAINNFNPTQIGALFSSTGSMFSGLAGNPMSAIQNIAGGRFSGIMSMAGNINAGQLGAVFNGQLGQLSGVSSLAQLGSIPNLSNLSNLGGLSGLSGLSGLTGAGGALSGVTSLGGTSSSGNDWLYLLAVKAMQYPREAACRPDELNGQNKEKMSSLCEKLRAPLIPLTKLKMRYHDPEKLSESELPSGVPDGLTFKEYFDGNMPYMRHHDTGRSLQKSTSTQQDPMDDLGQYSAIVGVGIEGVSGNSSKKDQRCLLGGWGENASFAGLDIDQHDPITSWTELKMHQLYSARKDGVYCIGRYEKVFKPQATEDKALSAAGGEVDILVARTGQTEKTELVKMPIPQPFLGYVGDVEESARFPNFGPTSTANLHTGLDNAKPGDILILPHGTSGEGDAHGLPKLCYVLDPTSDGFQKQSQCNKLYVEPTNNPSVCEERGTCKLWVQCADNGSAPTTCGITDALGQNVTRYFYKEGFTEELNEDDYEAVGSDMDCKDTNLSKCILKDWDSIKIYRPCEDERPLGDTPASASPLPSQAPGG
jgi:hypothetical protein